MVNMAGSEYLAVRKRQRVGLFGGLSYRQSGGVLCEDLMLN